ncbi:hypothetical protein GIB67_014371 [Kingdonia uniflora]|uniref:Uncharacterized protein n=1 Tax=Kingdonia uniflora TaxID=39325 RepID=A0A7J7LCY4_9MAGN|nr:hypothetical protein GIB67_014371 [Kingdonia uniflora]
MAASGSAYADVMEIPACDGVNFEAVEQEALDLATRDPIRLDTQIRSSISQLSVAWKLAAEVLKKSYSVRAVRAGKNAEEGAVREREGAAEGAVREGSCRYKLIQAFYVWRLSRVDVNLTLTGKYGEIVFPGDDASLVAEQTPAPAVDDDPTKEEVVHLRGKVIEMEKALSRVRDSINCIQQGQRAMRIHFFNIKKEDRKIYTQLENDLRHACDELERCKGHNTCQKVEKVECVRLLQNSEKRVTLLEASLLDTQQCLQISQSRLKKVITPKRGNRVADMDHERQMVDVIAFYGSELERVENEFRFYITSCGKDVEVKNDKFENSEIRYMRERLKRLNWDLCKARDSCQRKNDRAKTHEEACFKIDQELPEAIGKCNSQIVALDRDKQALVQECIQGNEVFEELHAKYNESQRMMDAAENDINYLRKVDNKLHRLKQEMERSVQITRQYRGSLLQEKKSLEARCKELDDELNKVKIEFYEATLLTAENVTLRVMAMLHADVEKFRTERESILAATTEYVTEYDLQLARLSYIDNLKSRVIELLNAPCTIVDATSPSLVLLSSGPGESLNVVSPKRE